MTQKKKTWQDHTRPYLKKALTQAARTWKPKTKRPNQTKIKNMQRQRDRLNAEIKKEKNK